MGNRRNHESQGLKSPEKEQKVIEPSSQVT